MYLEDQLHLMMADTHLVFQQIYHKKIAVLIFSSMLSMRLMNESWLKQNALVTLVKK